MTDTNQSNEIPSAADTAVVDSTHATPRLVERVRAYFDDRSSHDIDAYMAHYTDPDTVYIDVPFRGEHLGFAALKKINVALLALIPEGARTFPTKILGDSHSAVVFFTDETRVFGRELNVVAALDFRDGKIAREVDYSDGRHFTFKEGLELLDLPEGPPLRDLKESSVTESAAAEMNSVAHALGRALTNRNPAGAAALFASDGIFEDLTLHIEISGVVSLTRFLEAALDRLPYGTGSTVQHVLGSAHGGGYEWATPGEVACGIIALELDDQGLISRMSAMWDGSSLDKTELTSLIALTIE